MNQRLSAASAISSLSRWHKWADPGPKLLAALVMVIFLAVTYIAWQYAAQDVVHDLKSDFDYRVRETVVRIEQRMGVYAQILRGAQGMLAASDDIKREQFHTYVSSLQIEKNYPGIQGIGVVLQVPAAEKTKRIAEVWQLGSPDYSTWPDRNRAAFSSIVQFEPATDQNRRAIGYDMFSEPIRRAAMEQARDSGQIGITGKVRLVQEKEPGVQPGVVMYLPIYRKGIPNHTVAQRRANIVGWVFASFRMNDLMAKLNGERSEDIDIVIFDGETISPETMIYDTDDDAFTLDPDIPLLKALRRIDIAGRTWTIALHSMPIFEARSQGINPMLVAGSGIFLSLLMAALTYLLAAGRMRARVIAAEMMEELRESEEVWKFALEGAKDGVWDWNVSTGLVRFSTGWKEMLGYTEAEIGNNFDEWRKRAHPEDLPRVMTDLEAYFTGRSANYINEHRLLCKDGSWKWILTRGMVVSRTEYGQLLRVVGTHADITERKKAEQRERRLKDLYRALSASNEAILRMESATELFPLVCRIAVEYGGVMHAWVGVPDSEGLFVTVASHGKVLNFVNGLTVLSRPEAPEGRGPAGIAFREGQPVIVNEARVSEITSCWSVQANDNEINAVAAYPIMRGGKSFAIFVVYSDQVDAFDEEIVQLLGEMTANISFALDNFDREAMRRQAEGSLRASEEKFRTLFENAGDGISIVDKTGHFIDVNDLFAVMMGCSREEVLELGVADFVAQPEMVRVKEEMELLKKGMPLSTEYQSIRKDGTIFMGELNARLMPDGHMIGILRDITERRKTEDKLRLAALVYQNAREAMMVTDADGTIIDVNPAFTKLTGYAREEIAGENPRILKSGRHDNSFYEAMWRSITTNGQWQGEIWNRRKDGMVYPERLSINTVFNQDRTLCRYVAMFHDLTKENCNVCDILYRPAGS